LLPPGSVSSLVVSNGQSDWIILKNTSINILIAIGYPIFPFSIFVCVVKLSHWSKCDFAKESNWSSNSRSKLMFRLEYRSPQWVGFSWIDNDKTERQCWNADWYIISSRVMAINYLNLTKISSNYSPKKMGYHHRLS
jgi:hypothetical protein